MEQFLQIYQNRKRKHITMKGLVVALLIVLLYFGGIVIGFRFDGLADGIINGFNFIGHLFPPDVALFSSMLGPSLETLLLALLGTFFGFFFSLIFALAGANNISPTWLRQTSRFLIGLERALPEIIILLLLIAALGLGPFPGVIALSIGCVGMLGRLFADAIEELPDKSLEALRATGANQFQVIRYAVLPPISSGLLTNTLFRFEINIRLSVMLGAVGAGGIGYELFYAFQMLEYQKATTAILVILVLVLITEQITDYLRKKLDLKNA